MRRISATGMSASGAALWITPALLTNASTGPSSRRRTLEHRGHGSLVGDVALDGDRPATGGADVGRHGLGGVGPAGIVDRHVVAVARAQTADRGPDAARAAGDQQHLGHDRSPP